MCLIIIIIIIILNQFFFFVRFSSDEKHKAANIGEVCLTYCIHRVTVT